MKTICLLGYLPFECRAFVKSACEEQTPDPPDSTSTAPRGAEATRRYRITAFLYQRRPGGRDADGSAARSRFPFFPPASPSILAHPRLRTWPAGAL